MKRKTYHIKLDGALMASRHAWNASVREIRNIIRNRLEKGEAAKRINRFIESEFKDEIHTWETTKGRVLVFRVTLQEAI